MCFQCKECKTIYKCNEAQKRMEEPLKKFLEQFKGGTTSANIIPFNGDSYDCKEFEEIKIECIKCY